MESRTGACLDHKRMPSASASDCHIKALNHERQNDTVVAQGELLKPERSFCRRQSIYLDDC